MSSAGIKAKETGETKRFPVEFIEASKYESAELIMKYVDIVMTLHATYLYSIDQHAIHNADHCCVYRGLCYVIISTTIPK